MITTLVGYMKDDGTDRNMEACEAVTIQPNFDPKILMRPVFGAKMYAPAYKVKLHIGGNGKVDASMGDWGSLYKKVVYTPYTDELVDIMKYGWAIGESDLYTLCDGRLITHKMLSKYLTGITRNDVSLCQILGISVKSQLFPICNKWALFLMLNYREDVLSIIEGDGDSFAGFVAMEDLL